jgi:hypothetical protein
MDYRGFAIGLVRGLVFEVIGGREVRGLGGRNGECAKDMGLGGVSVFEVG